MNITVYSKPRCQQCMATKRKLDAFAVLYETIDITEDPGSEQLVKRLGHQQAPVVVVRDANGDMIDHWSGFRPDRIKKAVGR